MAKKISPAVREKITGRFVEAARTNNGRIHVMISDGSWIVRKEGAKRAISVKATQVEAIDAATSLKSPSIVIVHKKDGTVQESILSVK